MVMIAERRKMCKAYTEASMDVFSYRFDPRFWDNTELEAVQRFYNVAFSFPNISG